MNRFLPKKKLRAEASVEEMKRSETQPLQSVPMPHNWSWGKKKTRTNPRPEPILTTPVIPLSENFRTSLIMPNLSARFSMLREQDDPVSPLGKAKDDSVLSPKRRSRLIDFGHVAGNLTDVVETTVTADSIQTPPALRRKTSFTYGENPDADDIFSTKPSMLNRPRPGETNNMFGGQTETSRVPSTSSGEIRPVSLDEKASPRKANLQQPVKNDVEKPPFREFQEEDKHQDVKQASGTLPCESALDDEESLDAEIESQPSFLHNIKRDTTSSSTSGPSMKSFSTAPTAYSPQLPSDPSPSVSQSQFVQMSKHILERSNSRKMYEQGLTHYMYDQQAPAMHRANSVTLKGSGQIGLSHAHSISKLRQRFERSDSVAKKTLPSLELEKLTTFESLRAPKASASSVDKIVPQRPPLSHFNESTERTNVLFEAMDPSDRGKATAMAHFQKPKKFDEAQYLQRQMSLLQQQQRRKRRSVLSPVKKPTFPGKSGSPLKTARPRLQVETATINDENKTWSNDSAIDENDGSVLSENTIEAAAFANSSNASQETECHQSQDLSESSIDQNEDTACADIVTNMETRMSASVAEAITPSVTTPVKRSSSSKLTDTATSSPRSPEATRERRKGWSPDRLMSGMVTTKPLSEDPDCVKSVSVVIDDPYLSAGNLPGADLKGLVRAHLRQVSNVSSISPSPAFQRPMSVFHNMPSMYEVANAPNFDSEAYKSCDRSVQISADRPLFPTIKGLAYADTKKGMEVVRQHARGDSTESQHERVAFAKELAERQRAIQENLKIKTEHECRSPSPVTNGRNVFEHPFKPFGMLRAMSSRDSVTHKQEGPNKSYKWVDMSAEQFEGPGRAKDSSDSRVRSTSPPAVGRTLHSRMREPKYIKPNDIRVRKQRHGGTRAGQPERLTPQKENHRFSTILADSARSSIVTMTSLGRPSPLPSEITQATGNNNMSRSGLSHDQSRAKNDNMEFPTQSKTESKGVEGGPTSTPRRTSDKGSKSASTAYRDDDAKEDASPCKIEPNTPASTVQASASMHTPSTVSNSTFSTPALASSNASFSTPSTTYTASTSSPRQRDSVPTRSPEASILPPLPAKPIAYRTPLIELFPKTLGRSKTVANNNNIANTSVFTIKKNDISEPTLIASTSTVDTISLPEGASLKNGMGAAGDFDEVLAARDAKLAKEAKEAGLSGAVSPQVVLRKPWDGKENDRGQMVEKGVVVKERKGFLARMGRAVSAEKKENKW